MSQLLAEERLKARGFTLSTIHEIGPPSSITSALLHFENCSRVGAVLTSERARGRSSERMPTEAGLESSRMRVTSSSSSYRSCCVGKQPTERRRRRLVVPDWRWTLRCTWIASWRLIVHHEVVIIIVVIFVIVTGQIDKVLLAVTALVRERRVSSAIRHVSVAALQLARRDLILTMVASVLRDGTIVG